MGTKVQNTRRLLNAVAYWCVPPGVQCLLKKAMEPTVRERQNKTMPDLSTQSNVLLKNKHRGERCFILATGPSIKEQDLSVLEGELCIAVSHFFLHKDIKKISPRYHVLAPYHPPFNFEDLNKVFSGFDQAYENDVTYVFGHRPYEFSIYDFLQKCPTKQMDNIHYIDYTNSKPLAEDNYMLTSTWDIEGAPFEVRTVIYSAIQLATYLGCKEIYLLGCDHDYLQDTKRVTNHHFYREEEGVSDAEHLSAFTTERWFEEYYFRWKHYRFMREYAKNIGCEIYNSTQGGMLDVFPRRSLSEIFGAQKQFSL